MGSFVNDFMNAQSTADIWRAFQARNQDHDLTLSKKEMGEAHKELKEALGDNKEIRLENGLDFVEAMRLAEILQRKQLFIEEKNIAQEVIRDLGESQKYARLLEKYGQEKTFFLVFTLRQAGVRDTDDIESFAVSLDKSVENLERGLKEQRRPPIEKERLLEEVFQALPKAINTCISMKLTANAKELTGFLGDIAQDDILNTIEVFERLGRAAVACDQAGILLRGKESREFLKFFFEKTGTNASLAIRDLPYAVKACQNIGLEKGRETRDFLKDLMLFTQPMAHLAFERLEQAVSYGKELGIKDREGLVLFIKRLCHHGGKESGMIFSNMYQVIQVGRRAGMSNESIRDYLMFLTEKGQDFSTVLAMARLSDAVAACEQNGMSAIQALNYLKQVAETEGPCLGVIYGSLALIFSVAKTKNINIERLVDPLALAFSPELRRQREILFGLNLGRFSEPMKREVLNLRLEGIVERQKDQRPIAIVAIAESDYNLAFEQDIGIYDELKRRGYRIMYYEIRHERDLINGIKDTTVDIGKKADVLILGGHGSKQAVTFYEKYHGAKVAEEHMLNVGTKEARSDKEELKKVGLLDCFNEKVFIALFSCATAEGGAGAENVVTMLNEVFAPLKPRVVGPGTATAVDGLRYDENNRVIDVAYSPGTPKLTLGY